MQVQFTLNIDDRSVSVLKRAFSRRKVMIVLATLVAGSAVVYAASVPNTFSAGQTLSAAAMNANFDALATAVTALEGKIGSAPDCPPGYTRDTTATAHVLCKKGSDEMVKVGDFWADRYEISIVDPKTYNGGKCDGSGTQYGAGVNDDYPASFPDSAKVTDRLYACSTGGNMPSRSMTWFQAAAACAFSGKHLCTNGEWQVAALGTPDDSCNVSAGAAEKAGALPGCVSQLGSLDMVGNLWEWVDLWNLTGTSWMTSAGEHTCPWPSPEYGSDETWNINGQAYNGNAVTDGTPAAMLRGGMWADGPAAGVFAMSLNFGPSSKHAGVGARCCRR